MTPESAQHFGDVPAPGGERRETWAFTFSITGDLRFISHRDTARVFRRALARAGLPVRYSEGFNPHPRLSLPLPRPVGVASEADVIIVEFDLPIDGPQVLEQLNAHMPRDIVLRAAERIESRRRYVPKRVHYRIEPPEGTEWPTEFSAKLADSMNRVFQADILYIDRETPGGKRPRRIDLRPFLDQASLDGGAVSFVLQVTADGTARPREIAELLGFEGESVPFLIRRTAVEWHTQENPG